MVAGPVGRPGVAFILLLLKATEMLDRKFQTRLGILWDAVRIEHIPVLAIGGVATGTRMDEEGLCVLQSRIILTAEETCSKSACAPDHKRIFSFLVFLVSEPGEIRLFGH